MLLALSSVGCAYRTIETVTIPNPPSWVGQSVETLESVWGHFTAEESDGEGGRILVYLGGASTISPPTDGRSRTTFPTAPEPDSTTLIYRPGSVRAKFWANAQGTIYRVWFSETARKKERERTVLPEPVGHEP